MAPLISSFPFPFLILSACFFPLSVLGNGGFSLDLIHRDSPKSPLSDSISTPFSRIKTAAERSFARAIYLHNSMQRNTSSASSASAPSPNDSFYSKVVANSFEYLMRLYIGSPAKEILAIADTGSDLIWVQCKPCNECYSQTVPFFDPTASSTYQSIPCEVESCSTLPSSGCSSESRCEYKYGYQDESIVDGLLSAETLSFDSADGGRFQIPSALFGCTHHSRGVFPEGGGGIVGLSGGQFSLIRQLGSTIKNRFSYCLTNLNHTSATSRLNFGSSAVVSGSNSVVTPIILDNFSSFYLLSLDQISVEGQESVLLNPMIETDVSANNDGNIIIDSGTTLTLLDAETFKSVANKVADSVSYPRVTDPNGVLSLCFDMSGSGDDARFPDITFHFSGGAPVVLHPLNAFIEAAENITCLALASARDGLNVFGNIAQQNFHIGYDLNAMELTIAPADCANM